MNKKDRYVYFLYSAKQYVDRRAIEQKRSKIYTPGKVKTIGGYKPFTEISNTSTNRYSDTKVVCKGMLSEMKYTE